MATTVDIKEHTPVVGSDGQHVGTVDHFDGNRIKLTKSDPTAQGKHHFIDLSLVASGGNEVRLRCTAQEAQQHWTEE